MFRGRGSSCWSCYCFCCCPRARARCKVGEIKFLYLCIAYSPLPPAPALMICCKHTKSQLIFEWNHKQQNQQKQQQQHEQQISNCCRLGSCRWFLWSVSDFDSFFVVVVVLATLICHMWHSTLRQNAASSCADNAIIVGLFFMPRTNHSMPTLIVLWGSLILTNSVCN